MKETLKITRTTSRLLRVPSFENWTSGSGMSEPFSVSDTDTPEGIYQKVLEVENEQRTRHNGEKQRNVIYAYYVLEYEHMTDDRSKFGHDNQTSTKCLREIIPYTFVRGTLMTIAEALAKSFNQEISRYSNACLSNLINITLKFDKTKLTKKQLSTKIVMIDGEGERETFFEVFEKGSQMKQFPAEKLKPFKNNDEEAA